MKLTIFCPGDARENTPALHETRERMPEPSRVDSPSMRTMNRTSMPNFFNMDKSNEFAEIKTDTWERIKIVDGGIIFWAWRHKETQIVFI
jgi:hypothetical protein